MDNETPKIEHPKTPLPTWIQAMADEYKSVSAEQLATRSRVILALISGLFFDLQTDALVTQAAAQVEGYIAQAQKAQKNA